MIYLVKMFRLCSDFSECSDFFRQCSEFSVNVQNVQNLFRIFSQCSECSEFSVNVQNLFRICSQCSEYSFNVQNLLQKTFFRISSTKTGLTCLFRISWLCSDARLHTILCDTVGCFVFHTCCHIQQSYH
jgi:hypothetical protein